MKVALTVSPDIRVITVDQKTTTTTIVHNSLNHSTSASIDVVHATQEAALEAYANETKAYDMLDINVDKEDALSLVKRLVREAIITAAKAQQNRLEQQLKVLPF